LKHEYGFGLNKIGKGYDGVILAVSHKEYKALDEKYFTSLLSPKGILVDVKGIYREKMRKLNYWSL
jgi:UDP-N-acetyl-D-galactosamine dehydrogenase